MNEWYKSLIKPPFTPPDNIFMPVWSILYILIFLSLTIYILTDDDSKTTGYVYFSIQMILNVLWAPVFFILKNIPISVVIIILLDIFLFLTVKKFYSVSKIACLILIPYLIWVLFATYLNISYLVLN